MAVSSCRHRGYGKSASLVSTPSRIGRVRPFVCIRKERATETGQINIDCVLNSVNSPAEQVQWPTCFRIAIPTATAAFATRSVRLTCCNHFG